MAQTQKASHQIQLPQRKPSPPVAEAPDKAGGLGKSHGLGSGSSSGTKSGGAGPHGRGGSPALKNAKTAASPASTGSPATTTSGSPAPVPAGPAPGTPAGTGSAAGTSQVPAGPASIPGGSGEGRKISCEDIQLVQNLIERCLQLYMNQREVINTLQYQAKIEPGFTSLVWQKLEEQNPDFFSAYYTRLQVKEQMLLFNQLLDHHSQLLQKLRMTPPPPPGTSGPHKMPPPPAPGVPSGMPPPMHGAPMGYPLHRPPMPGHSMGPPHGAMRHAPPAAMPMRPPHGPMGHPYAHPPHGGRGRPPLMDVPALGVPSHLPGPPPHPGPLPALPPAETAANGIAASANGVEHIDGREDGGGRGGEHGAGGDMGGPAGAFPFGNADLGLGLPHSMAMGLEGSPFGSAPEPPPGSHGMQLAGETDVGLSQVSSRANLGSLGHLPRNFSLSDLASEFPSVNHADGGMLGGLPGSPPYMSAETEAYLRSPDKDEDEKLLDPLNDIDFSDLK